MSDFYNEEMAAQQERLARTKDMVHQRSEHMRVLSPQPGEHILELGSGNGIFARELVECVGSGGRVIGLDASETILEMARHFCPHGEFVLGDAQDLPFKDATFDAIVAAQLLCFLDDVDRALKEAFRVLKPGGRIVILDTDWDTLIWRNNKPKLMARMLEAYKAAYADPHLPKSLRQRLVQTGFSGSEADSFVVLNTDFGDDTYAKQTAGFRRKSCALRPRMAATRNKLAAPKSHALKKVALIWLAFRSANVTAIQHQLTGCLCQF